MATTSAPSANGSKYYGAEVVEEENPEEVPAASARTAIEMLLKPYSPKR